MNSNQNKFLWFTLVELIVVITIVWILSTVWFVSYSGYLTSARDSNRISQLTKLSDSLQVYSASKTLPLPDDKIDITASWAIIAYQWEVWVDVLETIDYTNWWKDPKDDTYYTYYLTKDRKSLQLMAMMEEQSSTAFNLTPSTNAVNYEDRYPRTYGSKLWILIYSDTSNINLLNTPANLISDNIAAWDLDIFNLSLQYTAHFWDTWSISWIWKEVGIAILWEWRLMWVWNFDSISWTSVPDISWRENNWILSGASLPVITVWKYWNALNFSSLDGSSWWYIEYPASIDLDTWTFTLSFWLNTNDVLDWLNASQIAKNFSEESLENDKIFTFQWDAPRADDRKRCRIELANWGDSDAQIQSDIVLSIWNHIACTFDWERLSVYLNWELEQTTFVSEPIARWKASMKIGAWWPSFESTSNYFNGILDEFYLYKKPFSSEEVKILYDATK